VSRDVDKIAGLHRHNAVFELRPRCTFQNNHPFMLILVIPESASRNMSVRNYPFNADAGSFEQRCKQLVRKVFRKIRE